MPILHTIKQVATATNTSESFWWKKIKAGEIETVRLGRAVRISDDTLKRFLTVEEPKKLAA